MTEVVPCPCVGCLFASYSFCCAFVLRPFLLRRVVHAHASTTLSRFVTHSLHVHFRFVPQDREIQFWFVSLVMITVSPGSQLISALFLLLLLPCATACPACVRALGCALFLVNLALHQRTPQRVCSPASLLSLRRGCVPRPRPLLLLHARAADSRSLCATPTRRFWRASACRFRWRAPEAWTASPRHRGCVRCLPVTCVAVFVALFASVQRLLRAESLPPCSCGGCSWFARQLVMLPGGLHA